MHQQAQRQVSRLDANITLFVGIYHVVHAGFTGGAGATERNTGTGYILNFECDVFHDMSHPGTIVFGQPT